MFTKFKDRKEELIKIIQHVSDNEKFTFIKVGEFYYTSMLEKKCGDNYILKIEQKKYLEIEQKKDSSGKKIKKECFKYFIGLYLGDKFPEDPCENLLFAEFSENIKSVSKNEFKIVENFYNYATEKEKKDNLCQEREIIAPVDEDGK